MPRDGAYRVVNRDGSALLLQYAGGRLVEVMGAQTDMRPKRRSTKRLGDSISGLLRQRELERQAYLAERLAAASCGIMYP